MPILDVALVLLISSTESHGLPEINNNYYCKQPEKNRSNNNYNNIYYYTNYNKDHDNEHQIASPRWRRTWGGRPSSSRRCALSLNRWPTRSEELLGNMFAKRIWVDHICPDVFCKLYFPQRTLGAVRAQQPGGWFFWPGKQPKSEHPKRAHAQGELQEGPGAPTQLVVNWGIGRCSPLMVRTSFIAGRSH